MATIMADGIGVTAIMLVHTTGRHLAASLLVQSGIARKKGGDAELLTWWHEWLKALDAEMSAVDEREEQRRHKRVELIQRSIAKTPSQGLVGIGIKLAPAYFLDGFF